MMPLLPPGWEWGEDSRAVLCELQSGLQHYVKGDTPDHTANMAWTRWEKDSGVTRERWDKLCMAESQLDEGRKGLCRWMAWHMAQHGAAFPPPHERPSLEAQKIEATGSWGAEEAVRLYG